MLKKAILVGLLAAVVYFVGTTVKMLGLHLHYYKHHPGTCRVVENAGLSSEDFHVTSEGLAFITSGVAFASAPSGFIEFQEKNKGRILVYNFKNPKKGAVGLKIKPSKTLDLAKFKPHGISVLEDKTKGEHLVYVVNHPIPEPDAVEKFRFNPKTNELVHLKSITSNVMTTTNDLAVVEEDKFYITNFVYFNERSLATFEGLFQLPLGGVLYYNGTGFTQVTPALVQPNGVFLSKDLRYLYVNMPMEQQIRVYKRQKDNSLAPVQVLPVYSAVDNLHLSQDGKTLYSTGHPVVYKILAHMEDPAQKAPSQVLQLPLNLKTGEIQMDQASELFYDHGDLIKASTVGSVYENSLLIGSLMDSLVVCDSVRAA
ncbi:serum paraoxonase/arylesterase 2 [Aplysia californica]|uniref:Serum paraoxonase/arylesterase 2 n=1 Tax=Aplysia californica TaxID=6500 RepID=A0ABM0JAU1_APLCA|nr:serum paraoxonase/arylesterase 2 [Aplysia californica]